MSTLSIKSRNPKSAAPKKGSVKSNDDIPAQGHVSCCQRQETDAIC